MNRIRNWDYFLVTTAAKFVGQPFKWGETDCANIMHDCINSMYDEPVIPKVPNYSTKKGAMRAFKKLGSMIPTLEEAGGIVGPVERIYRGDLIIVTDDSGMENVYVCIGKSIIFADEESVVGILKREEFMQSLDGVEYTVVRMP